MDKCFLDNFAFGRLWTSSEMIVSFSKIPALPGQKSHAYISEKVGRYIIVCGNSSVEILLNKFGPALETAGIDVHN